MDEKDKIEYTKRLTAENKTKTSQKRTSQILATIAAILAVAGIFSFISFDWLELSKTAKVFIILISMILSYGAGLKLKEKGYPKIGEAFIFLGIMIYGAGIFLTAQIFNIRANWPDGFILWMLGALAMTRSVNSTLLYYLAIPLGAISLTGYLFLISGEFARFNSFFLISSLLLFAAAAITFITGISMEKGPKKDFLSQIFVLLSIAFLGTAFLALNKNYGEPLSWQIILLITSIIGIILAYYFKFIYIRALSLIGIILWWGIESSLWIYKLEIKTSALFSGIALMFLITYLIGIIYEKEIRQKRLALMYQISGLIPITGFLFFLSTKAGIMFLEESLIGNSVFASEKLTFSILLFLVFFILTLAFSLKFSLISKYEAAAVSAIFIILASLAFLPEQNLFAYKGYFPHFNLDFSVTGITYIVILNIFVFLELLGFMIIGYIRKEGWRVNLGAILMFVFISMKYFDWFSAFHNKSAFFIVVLLIAGFLMRKGRKYLTADMQNNMV